MVCTVYADTCAHVLDALKLITSVPPALIASEASEHDKTCAICTVPFDERSDGPDSSSGENPVRLPCGHVFGYDCIKQWLSPLYSNKKTCPSCRADFFHHTYQQDSVGDLMARLVVWEAGYLHMGWERTPEQEALRHGLMDQVRRESNTLNALSHDDRKHADRKALRLFRRFHREQPEQNKESQARVRSFTRNYYSHGYTVTAGL
ncbi:MAG: hypothetical protein L6R40_004985 [Gallowayella cf. fulva]|nr:MAG: hypothetical protein L6R40_004985 [Xanthomendoza cf. fulva]